MTREEAKKWWDDHSDNFLDPTVKIYPLIDKIYDETKWHSVADGDLPEPWVDVIITDDKGNNEIAYMNMENEWYFNHYDDTPYGDKVVEWKYF